MAEDNVVIKVSLEGDYSDIENLDEIIEGLREKAGDIPLDFDENPAQEDVDGLQDQLEGFSMLAVGDVLQKYGTSAEGMAQQMNQASISVGQLATQTGIAEPQLVSMINNISNATFPNDEAMMYVKSLDQIGVSSGNLGKSATDLDKINDAFGLGASTTNSLGQELSVLGVDMNNVSSSFNALAYANANTVGGMDNYYSFIKKYDSQFKELGFNVDQASVIIAGATQKFGGGRAALSGLSDALKESNGDARALEQALGLQAGSIQNASQLTGEYEGQLQQLADEEAEHKTWLDQLGAAAEDASLSLSGIAQPFMGLIGLGGSLAGFGMQLNGVWELIGKLGPALSNLSITTKLAAAANWLLSAAQTALNFVMSMNPIILVVIALVALAAALIWAYNNVDWFRQMVDNAWQTLQKFGQMIVSNISNAVNTFGKVVQGIPQALQACLDWAYNLIMSHPIVQAIIWLGDKLAWGFSALGLGQGSPGKIFEAMNNELDWTEDAIYKSSLNDAGASLGANIGEGFNPNLATGNSTVMGGTSGNNITINIDSVDNEERIQQIVNAVEEALKFDNLKAGRSV